MIVSHENENTILECLKSIELALEKAKDFVATTELIVVLTSISNISQTLFSEKVSFILSSHNNLAANRTLILEQAKGDFVFYTDPDCVVDEDVFINLSRYFEKEEYFALAGNINNRSHNPLIDGFFRIVEGSKWISLGSKQIWQNKEIVEVVHASTSGIAYKRSVIGSHRFDSFFDRVGEDLEFNLRLHSVFGKNILAVPNAKIRHQITNSIYGFLKTVFKYGLAQGLVLFKSGNAFENPRLLIGLGFLFLAVFLSLEYLAILVAFMGLFVLLNGFSLKLEKHVMVLEPIFFGVILVTYISGMYYSLIVFWKRKSILSEQKSLNNQEQKAKTVTENR